MFTKAEILIVDDDLVICQMLSEYLTSEGLSVKAVSSGHEMKQQLAIEMPDLILLDVTLPDGDGFSLAREIRTYSDVSIIMLTGKVDSIDKVVGLELGADDYITKPCSNRELLARIRSVLRRVSPVKVRPQAKASIHNVVQFDGWRLDLSAAELVSLKGDSVYLTSYEFRLLSGFIRRPNHALTRAQILGFIQTNSSDTYERTIDVLIGKLRKKIEKDPHQPRIIKTVRGIGYRFTGKIERVGTDALKTPVSDTHLY